MTDDTAFARDLRTMLAARDPGPAPLALGAAIRQRLAEPRTNRFAAFARSGASAVALVAIAAALVLAIVVARPIATGPGATPAPSTAVPYQLAAGDGVATGEHVPVFQALGGLIAFAGLLLLAKRTTSKWIGIGAALGCLAVAFVATTIGTSNALAFSSGGYGVAPGRNAPPDEPGMYVAVTGDQPYTVVLTVTNASRLPLEFLGLAESETTRVPSDQSPPILPRFLGLARLPGEDMVPSEAIRFQPVTVAPGEWVNVVLLGRPGSCAIPTVGPEGQMGYRIETVNLVYEQLSIVHTDPFVLPEPIVITTSGGCS
jgi:hypothetical protein